MAGHPGAAYVPGGAPHTAFSKSTSDLHSSSRGHLTNDIVSYEKRELYRRIDSLLARIQELIPTAVIVWSCVLPRVRYEGFSEEEQPRIDRTRRAIITNTRNLAATR